MAFVHFLFLKFVLFFDDFQSAFVQIFLLQLKLGDSTQSLFLELLKAFPG